MRDPLVPEPVRVLFHLNGGFTQVLLERFQNNGHMVYGPIWDIPTAIIPFHLRPLGSRFILTLVSYDPKDLADAKMEEIDSSSNE